MGRSVQVCGAPTDIALESESEEDPLHRQCVLQIAHDCLALRYGEQLLWLLHANRFCGGSRHVVHLPSNVKFSAKNLAGNYAIAWDESEKDGRRLYFVNLQSGEVVERQLPNLREQIADVIVDAYREHVVVVGATTGSLYEYSWSGWNRSGNRETRDQFEWRKVDGTAVDAQVVGRCSCWRFIRSAVMGNCFVYMRSRQNTDGFIFVEKWIFDVEDCWNCVNFSFRALKPFLRNVCSTKTFTLFTTKNWKDMMLSTGSSLYLLQGIENLPNCSAKRLVLAHQLIDGVWIFQDAAFAMLLANGQISIAIVSDAGCFECVTIVTTNTMSICLSLSTLLGKTTSAALQLMWLEQNEQIIVNFGARFVAIKLSIIANNLSSVLADDSHGSNDLFTTGVFAQYSRRVVAGLSTNSINIDESQLFKGEACINDLVSVAKIKLCRSYNFLEDYYFKLLCSIHKQLLRYIFSNDSSQDPINCIGKSLRLMELLVSLTISMDAPVIRQISSKMLSVHPNCTSKTDRLRFYYEEIATISLHARALLSGISEKEDWWVHSTEVATFLRVYGETMQGLLHEIHSSGKLKLEEASHIMSLCKRIIGHNDGLSVADLIAKAGRISDPLMERFKILITSYTLLCCSLGVNGIMVDLEHVSLLASSASFKQKEFLCCFLKPWIQRVGNSHIVVTNSNTFLDQVVKLAKESNTLHLLVDFCMKSKSLIAHSCIQYLCKAAAIYAKPIPIKTLSDENSGSLHWQVCETYIGEAITILRQAGARSKRKYFYREEECTIEYVLATLNRNFNEYLQALGTDVLKAKAKNCATADKRLLREISPLDNQLRSRVMYLIMQIVWHLEAAGEDISNLLKQAFVVHSLHTQSKSSSEESEELRNCMTKVRAIIDPVESNLRFTKSQLPEDNNAVSSQRSLRISRSLILVAWALWLREKATMCSRGANITDLKGTKIGVKAFGAWTATCALQFNTLCPIYGDAEELQSIQLALLELAALMNPIKSAAVIAWGLPLRKILTQHLSRYRDLNQIIQQTSSLKKCESQFQRLQKCIRRSIQSNTQTKTLPRNDIDVLVQCCCDREFLQIMSVLAKCPYELISSINDSILNDSSSSVLETVAHSNDNAEILLPVETKPELISCPTFTRKKGFKEVQSLKLSKTRHVEDSMYAEAAAQRFKLFISDEEIQNMPQKARDNKTVRSKGLRVSLDTSKEVVASSNGAQKAARIPLQVCSLGRRRDLLSMSEANKSAFKPFKRHDSVRNALRLFRLRQEDSDHGINEVEEDASAKEHGVSIANSCATDGSSAPDTAKSNIQNYTSELQDRKHVNVLKNSIKDQRSKANQHYVAKERVYPLRLDYDTDNANLKLLGKTAQQRNIPMRRKKFVFYENEKNSISYAPKPETFGASIKSTDVIELKATSTQTNTCIKNGSLPVCAETNKCELLDKQQDDIDSENVSRVKQECEAEPIVRMGGGPVQSERRNKWPHPLSIADKYPIWIDLNGTDTDNVKILSKKAKKYLQVARFNDFDEAIPTTNNDTMNDVVLTKVSPSVSTVFVPQKEYSEARSEKNQINSQHLPTSCIGNEIAKQKSDAMKTRYRMKYLERFPVQEYLRSKHIDDRQETNGMKTLMDLRENMQQMTQRLQHLENCANSIDQEFMTSHNRLNISQRGGTHRARAVLEGIDKVLILTGESRLQEGARRPSSGLLSMKASSDLDAAKKVLTTIEQLTSKDKNC